MLPQIQRHRKRFGRFLRWFRCCPRQRKVSVIRMAIRTEWPLYFYLHRCLGCQLHAQCTACPNLRPRFGTTVDGRPSGEGWVSLFYPHFFCNNKLNSRKIRNVVFIPVSGWFLKSFRGSESNEGQGQAAHRRPLRGNLSPSGSLIFIAGHSSRGMTLDAGRRHSLRAEVCSRRQGRGRRRWWLFQTRGRCWGRQREDEQR